MQVKIYSKHHNLPNLGWDGDKEFKTADWPENDPFTPRELPLVFIPFLEESEFTPTVDVDTGTLFWLWILFE